MQKVTGLDEKMYGLDGQTPLTQDGQPLTPRVAIATAVARGQSPDPVRAMDVALKVYRIDADSITLDDQDVELIRRAVLADPAYSNLVKAGVLQALEAQGAQEKKKD